MEELHRHDLSDELWAKLEGLLPWRKGQWGRAAKDNRQCINAAAWIHRTGAPWRGLPADYGDWKHTNRRFCRWRDKGLWQRLAAEMLGEVDTEWLMLDSSCVKVHPDGCGAGGGNQMLGRTKGG
jgi:transposase